MGVKKSSAEMPFGLTISRAMELRVGIRSSEDYASSGFTGVLTSRGVLSACRAEKYGN
jgi:hypothetical protein